MIKELVEKSRSCRRFCGDKKVTVDQMTSLIDLARLSPYGANLQALKYFITVSEEINEKVFDTIGWAGFLKDWDGPVKEERPTGYIIMLRDKNLVKTMTIDEGIAAQSMFLGAYDLGLSGCMIGNIKRKELMEALSIPEQYEVALILALGYPKEKIVIEEMKNETDIKYFRDKDQVHHVPKRRLEELIVKIL